jgi:NTP pyrophosphatase (non-canonical NTP hydrolase)
MDKKTTVHELKEKVRKFCEDRDWDQFHPAKDLAIGISTEASELLAHFRFKSEEEQNNLLSNPRGREDIEDEIADVLYFLLRFAQKYDIDLSNALNRKIEKNVLKYPIEKSRGSSKKYNEI